MASLSGDKSFINVLRRYFDVLKRPEGSEAFSHFIYGS